MVAGSPRLMILSQRTTWLMICVQSGENTSECIIIITILAVVMSYIALCLVVSNEHNKQLLGVPVE